MEARNRHSGSSFDSFLEEEGILEEVEAVAVKRVIAWQIQHPKSPAAAKVQAAQDCNTGEYSVREHSPTELFLEVANADSGGFLFMSPMQALELGTKLMMWAQPKFLDNIAKEESE